MLQMMERDVGFFWWDELSQVTWRLQASSPLCSLRVVGCVTLLKPCSRIRSRYMSCVYVVLLLTANVHINHDVSRASDRERLGQIDYNHFLMAKNEKGDRLPDVPEFMKPKGARGSHNGPIWQWNHEERTSIWERWWLAHILNATITNISRV